MADNVTIPAQGTGTTTPIVRTDDVGGVQYQVVKLDAGGDGVSVAIVAGQQAMAASLPVVVASNQTAIPVSDNASTLSVDDGGGSLTVDGTVAATQSGAWNIGTVTAVTAISNALPAGTNNIGDVDVLTQPARAATTDTITAKLATDTIQNGTTALTPKFAAIAAASAGDNTLVAAVVGKKIRVLSLFVLAAGAVSAYVTSAAGGTVIFGGSTNKMSLAANGGFVLPFSPVGWFENSAANQALVLNLSGAVAVSGGLVYVEV